MEEKADKLMIVYLYPRKRMDNADILTSAGVKIVVKTIADIAGAEVGTDRVGTVHLTPIDIQLTLINVC